MTPTLKFVLDPMCPWCWAMAPHIETTVEKFDGRVAFDLAVGGINIRIMKPLGKRGLERLQRQWRRVPLSRVRLFAPFAGGNDLQQPLAVEAMSTLTRTPPFAYVHYLQRLLFAEDIEVLRYACEEPRIPTYCRIDGQGTGDGRTRS